jgi:hypothetical protein
MESFGLICFEYDYVPKFGTTFLINISAQDWKYHMFIYECSDPKDPNIWFGYYAGQRKRDKYLPRPNESHHRVNLNGLY